MQNTSQIIIFFSSLAALAGIALAAGDPNAGIAQALVAGAIELAIVSGITRMVPGCSQRLIQLVMAAVLVRMAAAAVFHSIPMVEATFAPDATGYDAGGNALAHAWGGGPSADWVLRRRGVFYYWLVGVEYFLLGQATLLPKVTNAALGGIAVLYTYRIARVLHTEETAWRAANLVAFFPSLILWGSLNIRDMLSITLVLTVVWHTLSLKHRFSLSSAVTLVVAIVLVGLVRDYLFPLMVGGVLIGLVLTEVRDVPRSLLVVSSLALVLLLVYYNTRMGSRFIDTASLGQIQRLREGSAIGARSAYLTDIDLSTPQGMLLFLPLGLAYFLLSPFPWQMGVRQLVTLPEMLFWYSLLPAVWLGLRGMLRERFRLAIVLFSALVALTLGYGVGSSNVGTAYRHRGQVMPLLLTFAAAGISLREETRRRRREEQYARVTPVRWGRDGFPVLEPPGG